MMDGFFAPRATYGTPWSGRVLVLAPGELPTTHFYLDARLAALPQEFVVRAHGLSPEALTQIAHLRAGTFVVIVRHVSAAVVTALQACRDRLAGVAYLVDDDLPGAWRCSELPLAYAVRTSWRYFRRSANLARLCDQIWVSSPALVDRCPAGAAGRVLVVPPRWHGPAPMIAAPGNREWFYHGTASHRAEAEWLRPVVARVQARCADTVFEIVGGETVARLFRGIPRVRVVPQQPWPVYYQRSTRHPMAVGVAPLLDRPFNRYRAPVKVFDITRAGGVGVFSDGPVFGGVVGHGETGFLVGNDPSEWADAVECALCDDAARTRMFAAAWRNCVADLGQSTNRDIIGVPFDRYVFGQMFKS